LPEANFDKLEDFRSLRYVRGCAGFARRSFTREFVERISLQMRAAIGDKWAEWGSEQVMSNPPARNFGVRQDRSFWSVRHHDGRK
jgi:hypothetical protein